MLETVKDAPTAPTSMLSDERAREGEVSPWTAPGLISHASGREE
jgi:hypothetical protein